jgi:formylglycine-generating enzyme required for sulfatase activity
MRKVFGAKYVSLTVHAFMVVFAIGIVTMILAQEGSRGVRIKQMKNNAGERWAICIGINDYEDRTIIDLKKARNDAKELGKVLKKYGQFDRVYVMTDDLNPRGEDYPKFMNIKRKMDFLKDHIDPEDLVLFSFSGHGIANSKGEGFLVMADSYREDFQGSSIKVKEVIEWLKEVKVKKSLLLLDACREQFQEGKALNLNGLKASRFSQAEVGAVFYSTKSGWFSYEDAYGNFGVFTRYVIDGLKGQSDKSKISGNEDGIITFSELASYVEEGVSNWALNKGKRQRPYTKILGEKFGDLALSAYVKAWDPEKKDEEIKEPEISEDKPADVKAVESRGIPVKKNEKGSWEADYGDGIVMVYIPEGEFTMGSNDGNNDEKPPRKVYLDAYWMGKTEVTVKQYMKFVNETKKNYPKWLEEGSKYNVETGTDDFYKKFGPALRGNNYPVVGISWHDASAYCDWLSNETGFHFKLPTEAQWEKAARGTDGRKYPWGNIPPSGNKVNYADKQEWLREKDIWAYKNIDDGYAYTAPVGSYPQGTSPYGLQDMAGNVRECCSDWYDSDYYKNAPKNNPAGPEGGTFRVIRGGGLDFYVRSLRCAYRSNDGPSFRYFYLGFRLRQDIK